MAALEHEDDHEPLDDVSLRDWFAGKALNFCLLEFGHLSEDQRRNTAEAAYMIADAMLTERVKGQKEPSR